MGTVAAAESKSNSFSTIVSYMHRTCLMFWYSPRSSPNDML